MKIDTRLTLAVYIPALMAAIVIIGLVFSYQELTDAHASANSVRQIRSSITELNHVVFSFALYHEARPKEQFFAEMDNLEQHIAGAKVHETAQIALLDEIRGDATDMKGVFQQLAASYESGAARL